MQLPHPPTVRLAAIVLVLLAHSAAAQSRAASQHASVTQTVGGTVIAIEYNRPGARGRALFGGIVPWGKEWNPGADSATRIRLSTAVTVNGKPLAAGEYSLWAIPDSTVWTVILSRAAHVYHTPYPTGQDALRIRVPSRQGTYMESLGLYFPLADGNRTVLYLHWGTTLVPLTIQGPP